MKLHRAFLVALVASTAFAQGLPRRATMVGGRGDSGKCTIEVDVDGSAEVALSGDSGNLRTLAGQTATWRRFQCSSPIPRNPIDFRFIGVDGRGRVNLIADPRNNRGTAVVRIDDPQGGREGYTFDVEWRGEGGGYQPGPPPGRPSGDNIGRAVDICRDGVRERLNRDGYREIDFRRIVPDDNPGRNDYIIGDVTGRRGGRPTRFSFTCSMDFRSLRVRSIDVVIGR